MNRINEHILPLRYFVPVSVLHLATFTQSNADIYIVSFHCNVLSTDLDSDQFQMCVTSSVQNERDSVYTSQHQLRFLLLLLLPFDFAKI